MPSTNCMADTIVNRISTANSRDETILMAYSTPKTSAAAVHPTISTSVGELPIYQAAEVDNIATEYEAAAKALAEKQAERMAVESDLSDIGDQIAALGTKMETAQKGEKTAIKAQIDGLKSKAQAISSKAKRLAQESWDAQKTANARGVQLTEGASDFNDLLKQLDTLSVRDGKNLVDETLAKSDSLKAVLRGSSREEAESLASTVGEALGSDRNYAQKLMNYHYQGAAQRISPETLAKMSSSDKELIRKAKLLQLNSGDYEQIARVLDNASAYANVSVGADLGRVKFDSVLNAPMTDKTSELRKLLSDPDVKTAMRDPKFADDAFNAAYDINPDVAMQYQKAAQDSIIADVKSSPSYSKLSDSNKKFIDNLYTKRTYTNDDIVKLGQIQETMGRGTVNNLMRGTVVGLGGAAKKVITSPFSTAWSAGKTAFKIWVLANGVMFVYFAAEEGFQTLIQMTGWNTPLDQYMQYMEDQGIPALESIGGVLGPLDWILDNIPFASVLFPAAAGFKWYNNEAIPGLMKDKLAKGVNGGLWVPDTGCTFGPGCFGHIRPESERPAYWAAHPETIGFLDGDLVRRIYDMQPDGSIGPNNLIAQGLGITDPTLAIEVGKGHMIAAGNMGAKDTLTKEFTGTYDTLVKGGAKSELAQQAYSDALAGAGVTSGAGLTIDPAATYVTTAGNMLGSAITDPSTIIGVVNPDGSVTPISGGPGSTMAGITMSGLTPDQRAALLVAPTKEEALSRYDQYNGTQRGTDAQAWRSVFTNPDGSLDMAKLKSVYPDLTSSEIQQLFPAEAVNKFVKADLASVGNDPAAVATKLAQYKAEGLINENARIEQYLPADQAAAFTARQNNPANFKITASGDTISWVDDTGYPHIENIIKAGKVLNPTTGQYDVDQKKQDSGGAEYTLDTGKYAAWLNAGGKDLAAFLADESNWTCTYNCANKTGSSGGKSSGGGSSKKSGGSSYSKTTGQTGFFIDAGGINAEVWENGAQVGTTDVIVETEAGVHTVTVKKAGYKSYTVPIQVYSGSLARKSVTLYVDSTTQTNVQKFINAIGGENALNPDHIIYAYAILKNNTALAAMAKASAVPTIAGTWSFSVADVKSLITTYGGA